MGFYDTIENVNSYIKMAEGYDGAELIRILNEYLPAGSKVLELGTGPGVDLAILQKTYEVTGSDASDIFLERYRKRNPETDLLKLDARTLETNRKFDGIYSNKVLHHLSQEELETSFQRQNELLNPGGILLHAFWHGEKEEFMHGLRFQYYTETMMREKVEPTFEILRLEPMKEMEEDDTLLVLLRKR